MDERTIQITPEDMQQLQDLIDSRMNSVSRDQQHLKMLAHELDRAEIVPADKIPADVVTMHSRVLVRDLNTSREATYTLSLPPDAEVAENKISILAPIATALLGYREGDQIEWPMPGGQRRLQIVKVLYQPEAVAADPSGKEFAARS